MLKTIQENLVYNQQNVFLQMPHLVIDKSSQKNATKTLLQSCRVGVKRIVQSCKQKCLINTRDSFGPFFPKFNAFTCNSVQFEAFLKTLSYFPEKKPWSKSAISILA